MTQPEPAPSPYYPSPPLPHSHDKFVGAIIAVGVIAVIVGATLGYTFGYGLGNSRGYNSGYADGRTSGYDTGYRAGSNVQPKVTFTHGTVDIYCSSSSTCFLEAIWFENQDGPDLGVPLAGEPPDGYSLYLESGKAYQVHIAWTEYTSTSSEFWTCEAHPQPFTPIGARHTQNFSC